MGRVGEAGGEDALKNGPHLRRGRFGQHLEHGPALHGGQGPVPDGEGGGVGQRHAKLRPLIDGHGHGRLLQEVAQLVGLMLSVGAGLLLAGLAFAQLLPVPVALGDVLHGLDDELHSAGGVEHGRVARQPVALHEPAGPDGVGHFIVLRGHFVRLAGGHCLSERGAHVGHGVGFGGLWVAREGVEEELPDEGGPLGEGRSQVVVAGRYYAQVRRQQQVGAG